MSEVESLSAQAMRCHTRDDRVSFIYQLFLGGVFQPGKTPMMLASIWECTRDTVDTYKVEADRHFRLDVTPKDVVVRKQKLLCMLDRVMHEAMRKGSFTAATQAAKLQASILGLLVHKVEINASEKSFDAWSVEELEKFVQDSTVPRRVAAMGELRELNN